MARTYPYSLSYDTCLGPTEDPFSFSSVYIEELYIGQRTYVKHVQQIVDLLPRTLDPSSRYTLHAHVTPPGHQRMRDSLRLALWWFLPRDGNFKPAADGLHYYLARQGRRVVLRGGNVTSPLHESRLLWIHDPHRSQSSRVPPSHPPASRRITQCPGLIIPCPGLIIQCPGLIIQCPGVITKYPETVKMRPEIVNLCVCVCDTQSEPRYPCVCSRKQSCLWHLSLRFVKVKIRTGKRKLLIQFSLFLWK